MSIKDLFGKSFKNYSSASSDVESSKYVTRKVVDRETFIPNIDFSTASNFAIYGSAELYYSNSIKRVYNNYPYDGSNREKVEFHLSSSYLDRWIYDSKYPKTTGYVHLGSTGYNSVITDGYGGTVTPEYIRVWGGLHTASSGMSVLSTSFEQSTKYDLSRNLTQNWRLDASSGSTVEFWLKKDAFTLSNSEREVILDLWNGELSSSSNYGRLTLELTGTSGACFVATYQSGTAGFYRQTISSPTVTTSSLTSWHHYAMSFLSAASGVTSRFYVDGKENHTQTIGTPLGEIYGRIDGYIGALQASPSGSTATAYSGKLSASMDEFRFWKTRRNSNQIEVNWFTNINGGANHDDDTTNNDLSIYFKFNEGIIGSTTTDQTILDYSGRLANGYWKGYSSTTQRNTGSAFVSSSHSLVEIEDPIIYSSHSRVVSLESEMTLSGSQHDNFYGSSMFSSLPYWMQEEDGEYENNLKKIVQIMSTYFDTLHSQIGALSDLQNKRYVQEGNKPLPFAKSLLTSKGFQVKDIFANSSVLEVFANRSRESIYYENNLEQIKNLIYTNIYNNLETIYKTKGTEKSVRNLIRCFGVDDEIIKLNVYTDGGVHYLTDKAKATSLKKKYINFDKPEHFSSTIYQTSSATNSLTFISGSTASTNGSSAAFTLEADIIVPFKKSVGTTGFYNTSFLSSSIFGFHEAIESDPSDYTWATSTTASLSVYLVRDVLESKRAKFVVKSQDGTIDLSSGYISNIYDNNHWNIALRIKPDTYPYAGNVTNTTPNYTVEFYGIDYNFDEIQHEITLSKSISNTSGSAFLSNAKRVYAGAHLTNFSGAVLQQSDVQIGSIRSWLDYVDNDTIKSHNKDPFNYGNNNVFRGSNIFVINNKQIPSHELSILNWDFDTVTGSDSSGEFIVDDLTSGSTDTIYGWIDEVIRREYRGKGDNFGASKSTFVENEFLYSQKKELPEISYTNDDIVIKGDKEKYFIKDDDVSNNFYMVEKSLGLVVSEEMLNMFSSIQEFANLISAPVDRYRQNYKRLDKARQQFFDNIEGDIDQEKFLKYFKWIDSSISNMISQLVPASVRFGSGVNDVIESHILERNKYQRRPGLLNAVDNSEGFAAFEGSTRGIAELTYNWSTGHAPLVLNDNKNCLWQKQRKEREDIPDRERIRKVLNNNNENKLATLATPNKSTYQASAYATRRLSRPYKLNFSFANSIHGGINFNKQKNRDFYKTTIGIHGPMSTVGAPRNIIGIGIGATDGINNRQKCDDTTAPNSKTFYDATVMVGKYTADAAGIIPHNDSASYSHRLKASNWWPFNLKSGSISTGYNSAINSSYVENPLVVVNLHSDTTDPTNEIPMQGPFTQAHVGGHQGRHVNLNKYDTSLITEGGGTPVNNIDDQYSRPEAYRLLVGDNPYNTFTPDGALGITGPDYGLPYPNTTREWAIYYREERIKRAVNIKNIQTTTESSIHGNFQHNYEVVSTCGGQTHLFRKSEKNLLPDSISNILPKTTNYMTLVSQDASKAGNVFGVEGNNRQPRDRDIEIPRNDLTSSKSIILNRFSAPGGPEINSRGYLDVSEGEYSVYNSINYRNLSIRGSGSGESGTIRVNSHANRREGLRTLRTRHQGQFGIDSQYGAVTSTTYETEPSYHKQHRNSLLQPYIVDTIFRKAVLAPSGAAATTLRMKNESPFGYPQSGGLSFNFWINFDKLSGAEQYIFNAYQLTEPSIVIYSVSGEIFFRIYNIDSSDRLWVSKSTISTGSWRFITISWSGKHSESPHMYLDGLEEEMLVSSTSTPAPVDLDLRKKVTRFYLFDKGGIDHRYELEGSLANFSVFSSQLSKEEAEYLQEQDGIATSVDGLGAIIDYWELGTEQVLSPFSVGDPITPTGTIIPSTVGNNSLETESTELLISQGPYEINIVADERIYDNLNYNSLLPRSDFQYAWISNTISGSNWEQGQKLRGFSHRSGEMRIVGAGFAPQNVATITFPTASTLYGE